ncbi:MAG: UvrD-helicase domain-containing protein [Bacteroidota bacterium]
MKNLLLYTASAGSGKTYQLALNYIRELFSDPASYRHILAVTFTNKAAAEMKKRILEKLYQLSLEDKKASDYTESLIKSGAAASREEVKQKADFLLRSILNSYSAFYVQTIDKFFQWVIRGFVREIGLQNGYVLELDNSPVLMEAIDLLMFDMEEDEQLKSWLIRFAEDKIKAGKSWDFYSDILTLGNEAFKETYQSIQDETEHYEERMDKFNSLLKKLISTQESFENSLKNRARKALDMIENQGLKIADFKGGSRGVATIFSKAFNNLPGDLKISDTNRKGANDLSLWVKKNDPNEDIIRKLFEEGLNQLLMEIIDLWDQHKEEYYTSLALKNNLYTFGILNDISDRIREISREKNLFLISDASLFLKKITGENDAPFIYEKAGNHFFHYMLDEFQDTSRFQWDNFLPLIENGLSTGKNSIVVGDVKQSIYRWRNSDWKILAAELHEKISSERITHISLDTNYRSNKNIVAFNNSLFHAAPEIIKQMIKSVIRKSEIPEFEEHWLNLINKIYGEPRQKFFPKEEENNGYISHRFLPRQSKSEQLDYIKEWLPKLIKDLQDRHYSASDITILVRTGSEGRKIARILMDHDHCQNDKYNFNVISSDSLYIAKNPAVRFLTALLKFFNQPYDKINSSYIRHEYLAYVREINRVEVNWHAVFTREDASDEPMDEAFLGFEKDMGNLRKLHLYDLTESLIKIFRLNKNPDKIAYVQAFQDHVLEFTRKEGSDISAFLKYWENTSPSATLNISETQEAIRIMTIHKAKGLEFKIVIIPYCDWGLEPNSHGYVKTLLWPNTASTPYREFSHMPVSFGPAMRESNFKADYYEELFRTYVDNLNLLYVAFTRAESELHSLSALSNDKGEIKNVGDMIFKILNTCSPQENAEKYPVADLNKGVQQHGLFFSYGKPEFNKQGGKPGDSTITGLLSDYPVAHSTAKLVLNHKNIYLSDLKEDDKIHTGYGTQMHEILAGIKKYEDIGNSVRNAWLKGLLDSEERVALEIELSERLSKLPLREWFSGCWDCRTETDIMNAQGEILRPDRVMIKDQKVVILDYKFGYHKKEAHKKQLHQYYHTLKSAGYKVINLYLWYYRSNEIEEVEL